MFGRASLVHLRHVPNDATPGRHLASAGTCARAFAPAPGREGASFRGNARGPWLALVFAMRRALLLLFALILAACGSGLASTRPTTFPGASAERAAAADGASAERATAADTLPGVRRNRAFATGTQHAPSAFVPTNPEAPPSSESWNDEVAVETRTVVALELSRAHAADSPRVLFDATQAELRRCVAPLSADVEGHLLLRLVIDDRPAVTAVTVAWDIIPAVPTDALPDSLLAYADAVDCIEATLIDAPVPPAVPQGQAQLDLQLVVTRAPPAPPLTP